MCMCIIVILVIGFAAQGEGKYSQSWLLEYNIDVKHSNTLTYKDFVIVRIYLTKTILR